MNRNLLYEIKKEAAKKVSPLYEPNNTDSDIRNQNKNLRTMIRKQQTQIIRLNSIIDQLKDKVLLFETTNKLQFDSASNETKNNIQALSKIPMLLQNTDLKKNIQHLHTDNLDLNGKNNRLQAQMRQLKGDYQRLKTKVRQLQIAQKVRAQRFQEEVQNMAPIVIEHPKQFETLKQGVLYVLNFLRGRAVDTVYEIFLISAKQCETQKKSNSFIIFRNYWKSLKSFKNKGLGGIVTSYLTVAKLYKMTKKEFLSLESQQPRDTVNQWIKNTSIQIKHMGDTKQLQTKLFRYLGLIYRSKFPIQGDVVEMDQDIKMHLEDLICQQLKRLLYGQI